MKIYRPLADGAIRDYSHTVPVVVPDTLDELVGPTTGTVVLPVGLDWSLSNTYDLDDSVSCRSMYAVVLREAKDEEDLRNYLNGGVLIQVWPDVKIPKFTRMVWETTFPDLLRRRSPVSA